MVSSLLKRWRDDSTTVKRQRDGFGAFRKETGCHPVPPQALYIGQTHVYAFKRERNECTDSERRWSCYGKITHSLPALKVPRQSPLVLLVKVLFLTQEKSFDLGSTDPCGSLKVVNLWLETDVFQLRKHYAVLLSSSAFCVQVTWT
jgi:hypothetical protein